MRIWWNEWLSSSDQTSCHFLIIHYSSKRGWLQKFINNNNIYWNYSIKSSTKKVQKLGKFLVKKTTPEVCVCLLTIQLLVTWQHFNVETMVDSTWESTLRLQIVCRSFWPIGSRWKIHQRNKNGKRKLHELSFFEKRLVTKLQPVVVYSCTAQLIVQYWAIFLGNALTVIVWVWEKVQTRVCYAHLSLTRRVQRGSFQRWAILWHDLIELSSGAFLEKKVW